MVEISLAGLNKDKLMTEFTEYALGGEVGRIMKEIFTRYQNGLLHDRLDIDIDHEQMMVEVNGNFSTIPINIRQLMNRIHKNLETGLVSYEKSSLADKTRMLGGIGMVEEMENLRVEQRGLVGASRRRVASNPNMRGVPFTKASDRPARLHPSEISPHRWLESGVLQKTWVCQICSAQVKMRRPNVEPPSQLQIAPGEKIYLKEFEAPKHTNGEYEHTYSV